jgi:hypothetical protein
VIYIAGSEKNPPIAMFLSMTLQKLLIFELSSSKDFSLFHSTFELTNQNENYNQRFVFSFRTFASERVSLRLCKSVAANGKPFKCPSLDKRAKKHCSAFIWFALQNVLHLNISHCVVFMLNDEFLHRHSCTGTLNDKM